MANFFEKQIELQRRLVKKKYLPQTCKVRLRTGTAVTITGPGIATFTPQYRSYEGSEDIPCRVDILRALRAGQMPNQVVATDEYNIEFPFDFDFDETDVIELDDGEYVIRKAVIEGDWLVTREALLNRIGVNSD